MLHFIFTSLFSMPERFIDNCLFLWFCFHLKNSIVFRYLGATSSISGALFKNSWYNLCTSCSVSALYRKSTYQSKPVMLFLNGILGYSIHLWEHFPCTANFADGVNITPIQSVLSCQLTALSTAGPSIIFFFLSNSP